MFIKQIYTSCLSQASYYIESDGEAIIIDPIRDSNLYTDLVIDYFKIKSELEEAKKQVAGWSAMAGRYASGQ